MKILPNEFSIPPPWILVYQLRNHHLFFNVWCRMEYSVCRMVRDPSIIKNPYVASITYPLAWPPLQNRFGFHDALPHVEATRRISGLQKMASWKIPSFQALESNDSWSCINLQPCFASIVKLKWCKSLNPIPSSSFGLVSLSQLSQWIFLSFLTYPYQNRAHMDWSSSHNLIGNWKTLILYVGIDCATALIRISFPACDKIFPFHPCSFFHTLSLRKEKVCYLLCPTKVGNPK